MVLGCWSGIKLLPEEAIQGLFALNVSGPADF